MESLQQVILDILNDQGTISDTRSLTIDGAQAASQEAQLIVLGALNSLLSREIITYETHEELSNYLTPEAEQIAKNGSHEAIVWANLPMKGEGRPVTIKELEEKVGVETTKNGRGTAFKNGWIGKQDDGFVKLVPAISDTVRIQLQEVHSSGDLKDAKVLATLKKRKLVAQRKTQWFTVHRGVKFTTSIKKQETDLTAEMLTSGSWKTATFKAYNFEADGTPTSGGALHPLMKVREEICNIFLEMGFAEMPTQSFVESAFWCFDSLFVPQQHPAREMQDTFYTSDPSTSLPPPDDYYTRVAEVHEHGGYGSIGYRAPFSREESQRLLLRTHTTACSSRLLREIATQPGGFKPAKLFSIDRVFRNEATDMTHLAEFHQVEGVVADRNITLADLIGFMRVFFQKMGIKDLRFKPAYNPYTEPSLEIYAFHPLLDKWVEIGNSGMFRPEMLEPMGLPENVRVLGWGIGLERPTMIRYGISNIRTLVGHKVSIEGVEKSPAVRF